MSATRLSLKQLTNCPRSPWIIRRPPTLTLARQIFFPEFVNKPDAFVGHTLKYSSERQKSGLQNFDSSYKSKRGLAAVGTNTQDLRYGCRFRVYGVHTVYDSNVTSINVMCTSVITLGVPVDCCRSKPRRTCQRRPRAGGVSKNDVEVTFFNGVAKAVTQEKLQWGAEMHNVHWHAHGHVLRLSSSWSPPDVSSRVFHCRIGRHRTQ